MSNINQIELNGTTYDLEDVLARASALSGQPIVVTLASAMTNTDAIYLYLGSEQGYDYGYIYVYLNGAWTKTNVYGATTLQDGSITEPKLSSELSQSIDADGLKKMWSIQTNSNSSGTFYQMAVSVDGIGSTLVEDTESFLTGAPSNIGSDWLHFRHGDYHVFTITYVSTTADFYIAITKDFTHWVHKAGSIGFRNEGSYTNPYVWTPQIFEFNNKLYMSATVQEGAPVSNASRYQTMTRYSGIYVAEISLDYDTADVTKLSSFTRVSFSNVTDKQGNEHSISGNAMDAWFVPFGDKIVCVFNDRYMLEIHTAIADSITDTFTILAQNIFVMPCTEAPTVLQVSENLWQICGCYYGGSLIAKECNIRCMTSDFEHFYEYAFIKRIDVEAGNTSYTGRMRNPSFFYMSNEQEHDFCKTHPTKTCGYQHIFEPSHVTVNYNVVDMLNYTDVAIPANTELLAGSTTVITIPKFDVPTIYGCDKTVRIVNANNAVKLITYNGTAYRLGAGQSLLIDYKGDVIGIEGIGKEASGANVLSAASDSYDISACYAVKKDNMTRLDFTIGSVALNSGDNTVGTLKDEYATGRTVYTVGYIGSGSSLGNAVRIAISSKTIHVYAGTNISASSLRFSVSY